MSLNVRVNSWLSGNLSWAYVMGRLGQAFEELGHNVYTISTNGLKNSDPYFNEDKMLKSVAELQKFGPGKQAINIDLTYTVPQNFPKRFLQNSKNRCAIYNYETWSPDGGWPKDWAKYYGLVDYFFPSSSFSAEVFVLNKVPAHKIFVIPHGVDQKVFNPSIPKIKLNTDKKYKFVSVTAPHFRKNIPGLLHAYCQAFSAADDVCLVLKTKAFKHSDGIYDAQKNPNGRKGFEIVLGDTFKEIAKKYGKNIPSIELVQGHVENVASVYNAASCNISCTGSEGNGMIFSEALSCGLLNIAPRYSGQLDLLNDDNSLLIDTTLRPAKNTEQYWNYNPKSMIGEVSISHAAELMQKAHKEHDTLLEKFRPNVEKAIKELSWTNQVQKIINAVSGNAKPYVSGTYKLK